MEPIAERTLEIVGGGEVRLRVFKPVELAKEEFGCEYEIAWPDRPPKRHMVHGIDAFQALQIALRLIPAELEISPEMKSGRLLFLGGSDLGLLPAL